MPQNTITIKPNNHRIHPCATSKKRELLKKLLEQNANASILICSKTKLDEDLSSEKIRFASDEENLLDAKYELVISLDIPEPEAYIARVSKATNKALALVDESEQKSLYPIEMILGRAIKQEVITGFEYEVLAKETPTSKPAKKRLTKEQIKEEAKKRYTEKTALPKEEKEHSSEWEKKDKKPNKFLGKDKDGKAKFSGKTGDRNHKYDGTPKGKYSAPKKVGKKINIKALKKTSEDE